MDNQIKYAIPWFNPTLLSPDYHNACDITGVVSVPSNWIGNQNANTGIAYAGIGVAGYSGGREYIEVPLTSSLQAGKIYCGEFYVSLADSVNYATDDIGMYFSNGNISGNTIYNLSYTPQIFNTDSNFLTDKINWTLVSGLFIANGGENYLTIGNFKNATNTDSLFVGGGGNAANPNYQGAYYYIDDVSIILCDSSNDVHETLNRSDLKIYPNPSNGAYHIKINNFSVYSVNVYNELGNLIFASTENKSDNFFLDLRERCQGIYFLIINTNKNNFIEKLSIIKSIH